MNFKIDLKEAIKLLSVLDRFFLSEFFNKSSDDYKVSIFNIYNSLHDLIMLELDNKE